MKMKKILALLCALAMVFTLAACGGGDDVADDNNGGDAATDGEEVTMKTVTLGDVSIDLPDFFGEPQETSSGALGVAGPESSVTVAGPVEMDITLDMWSEEFAEASLEGLFGATYTDLTLISFQGPADFDGTPGVVLAFGGTNSKGVDRVVYNVYLYDDTQGDYVVSYMRSLENPQIDEDMDAVIVGSITLG